VFNANRFAAVYLRLAFTEQQLHTSFDEFGVCNEFKDDRGTISRAQQVLRMVDGNNPDRLANGLRYNTP
jgi:hypothetical protein